MVALNNGLVTRQFSVQGQARAGKPDKRMKPQCANYNFMDKPDEVVVPSCMRQFVDKNSVKFMLTQQPLNSSGKGNVRTQNPVHRRSVLSLSKLYRHTVCNEIPTRLKSALTGRNLIIAAASPYPNTKPRKH